MELKEQERGKPRRMAKQIDASDWLGEAILPEDRFPQIPRNVQTFIVTAASTPLQSFDPIYIQEKCADTAWPNDLVFECDEIVGGVGNVRHVRQAILACFRWDY